MQWLSPSNSPPQSQGFYPQPRKKNSRTQRSGPNFDSLFPSSPWRSEKPFPANDTQRYHHVPKRNRNRPHRALKYAMLTGGEVGTWTGSRLRVATVAESPGLDHARLQSKSNPRDLLFFSVGRERGGAKLEIRCCISYAVLEGSRASLSCFEDCRCRHLYLIFHPCHSQLYDTRARVDTMAVIEGAGVPKRTPVCEATRERETFR